MENTFGEINRMKNQLIIIGITLLFLVVGLSGCNEKSTDENLKSKFVGTWTSTGGAFYMDIIVLYADGVASYTHHGSSEDYIHPGTWEVKGDKLIINRTDIGSLETFTFRFTNDETLILTMDPDYYGEWETTYKKS